MKSPAESEIRHLSRVVACCCYLPVALAFSAPAFAAPLPTSEWATVPLGGGGYVPGLAIDASGKKVYCRTDVGGALRWLEDKEEWISITDRIVPHGTPGAAGLMGVGAITLDPSLPNRVYMALGSYGYSKPRGVYASEDSGATWTQIEPTGVVEANGPYRGYGNRLAVDPNDSNTLWLGTVNGGLMKGTRSGKEWTWATVPESSVPFGNAAEKKPRAGVTFVACDKNDGKTITYAGVHDSVGDTGGVYVTTDGTNWTKVGGAPFKNPGRGRLGPDGTLFVTAGKVVGKIPRGGGFSPLGGLDATLDYGAIAPDPSDPTGKTLYVAESTTGQFGKIFRTTDGGATWVTQFRNVNGGKHNRTEPDGTPSLTGYWFGMIGDMLVNPANPEELWLTDFFGVYRTRNASALGTAGGCHWFNLQKGQEETVPHCMKNAPTGSPLITGLADVSGFRYSDITKRPTQQSGGNALPDGGSSTSLDFCEADPKVWARAWMNPYGWGGSGGSSIDGGVTWLKFGQIAEKIVTCDAAGGVESWDVGTFLKGQKKTGATEVTMILLSGNSISPLYSGDAVNFLSRESADAASRPRLKINGSTTLTAVADGYVGNDDAGKTHGTEELLKVSYAYGNAPHSRWTYVKFDLSGAGDISTAALELTRKAGGGMKTEVGVYVAAAAPWSEETINWQNKPAATASDTDPIGMPAMKVKGGRIAVSAKDSTRLVWLPEAFVKPRYSIDRGATWTESKEGPTSQMANQFNPGIGIQQLAADRVNGKFYMAYFGANHVIYSSTDGGETFKPAGTVNAGTYNIYRAQLIAGLKADHLWLADDGVDTADGGGLWRSTDGGATWSRIEGLTKVSQVTPGKGKSGDDYAIFINGKKDGVKKIYRSDDYGTSWTALPELPSVTSVECVVGDRQNYGQIFIGMAGRGIFVGK